MSGHKRDSNEIVVRNDAGDLEVIDVFTGELVSNSSKQELDENIYKFSYPIALLICQEVRSGRTLLSIGNDESFPPLHVIQHWKRSDRMFQEELSLARKERAEHHADKVLEIADNACNLKYTNREEIANAKLAADQYKWAAEKGNPENFGSKVTHEGSTTKPIIMRVINTGINRAKPDIVITKEVTNEQEEGTTKSNQERPERESADGEEDHGSGIAEREVISGSGQAVRAEGSAGSVSEEADRGDEG